MTHFNHDWDMTVTPAIPVATGDRYYAQDLNDDFNYLKHLPCEFALQGKTKGVIIPPTETWDGSVLALTGGVGAIVLDTTTLNVDESFTVPPKTTTAQRYERIAFTDASLTVPDDGNIYYIVATVTKRSLLQRAKALLSEQYASRIRYDGVLELQTTAPTDNQILVGLICLDGYVLCRDVEHVDYCIPTYKLVMDLKNDDMQPIDWVLTAINNLNQYYQTSHEFLKTVAYINTATMYAKYPEISLPKLKLIDSSIYFNFTNLPDPTPGGHENVNLGGGSILKRCRINIRQEGDRGCYLAGWVTSLFVECDITIHINSTGRVCGIKNAIYCQSCHIEVNNDSNDVVYALDHANLYHCTVIHRGSGWIGVDARLCIGTTFSPSGSYSSAFKMSSPSGVFRDCCISGLVSTNSYVVFERCYLDLIDETYSKINCNQCVLYLRSGTAFSSCVFIKSVCTLMYTSYTNPSLTSCKGKDFVLAKGAYDINSITFSQLIS